MSLNDLSALAQILSAIGVIASLGYLARQIKASVRASEHAALQDVLDGNRVLLSQLGASPEVARVWRLGMAGDQSLNADEAAQFHALVNQLAYNWMRIHHLAGTKELEPWVLETYKASRRDIANAPGFQNWYSVRKHWMSRAFRAELESEFGNHTEYQPLALGHVKSEA